MELKSVCVFAVFAIINNPADKRAAAAANNNNINKIALAKIAVQFGI